MAETFQAHNFVNEAIEQITGEKAVLQEDYGNIVDIGDNVIGNKIGYDHFTGVLVDRITKTRFADDDRTYNGVMPDVRRDGATYGAILQTIWVEYPDAKSNEVWELQDGAVYEQDDFTQTVVHAKYYNHRNTFKHKVSITRRQVKEAFASQSALEAFIGYIISTIDTAITMDLDELTRAMFKNFIGEVLYTSYNGSGYGNSSKNMAVNLLYLYNTTDNANGTPLAKDECLADAQFLRFASKTMAEYKTYLAGMSTLFNLQGRRAFSPVNRQRWCMLNKFVRAEEFNAYSDTFHEEFIKLPNTDIVPYWQGSGMSFAFEDVSKVYGITAENHSIEQDGILAVCYDENAMMIYLADRYADTHHNSSAQFDNYYFFADENDTINYWYPFIVFFVEDAST